MPVERTVHAYPTSSIHMLECCYALLTAWQFDNLSAPYWRVYWHSNPGGWISHHGRKTALTPRRLVLIAPDTPFASGLSLSPRAGRPVGQAYAHFVLGHPQDLLTDRVRVLACGGETRRQLEGLVDAARAGRRTHAEGLVFLGVVAHALSRVPHDDWPEPTADRWVADAIRLMEDNVSQPLSNDALAGAVSMSTSSFVHGFTARVGVSPHRYLLKLRLDKACDMLHHTDESIDAIAGACGFQERGYFSRVFAKKRGVPPAAFRKQNVVTHPPAR